MPVIQVTPNKSATIYAAASMLHKRGPMTRDQLFAAMDFGPKGGREEKLRQAFDFDWLRETPAGQIEVTEFAGRHFDCNKPRAALAGEPTAPAYRGNVFASPGLSKQYIPNRRGPRADVPAWSVREKLSIKTAGGGAE